jgi:hypothetical protein
MTASPFVAGAVCILIVAAFVIPLDATSIAAFIGFDMHMASFMIGPATYSFGKNLIPGIDYFTQYSVGTPWFFSFFLAPTATATMVSAVWFVVAEILIFQLSLLFPALVSAKLVMGACRRGWPASCCSSGRRARFMRRRAPRRAIRF